MFGTKEVKGLTMFKRDKEIWRKRERELDRKKGKEIESKRETER